MAFTSHGHQIKYTPVEERPEGMRVARCGGTLVCLECARQAAVVQSRLEESAEEKLKHDDETMLKVYGSLMDYGMTQGEALGVVSDMQNKGILFRERA